MRSPVVFTWPRSMPRSRARARTAGEARTVRSAALLLRRLRARLAASGARGGVRRRFDRGRSACSSACAASARPRRRQAALPLRLAAGRGFGRRLAVRFDHREHRADRNLVADLARKLDDLARDRRFHLHRRLVGHHVGDLLVFLDAVADLHVPGDDLRLGNAFADVRQLELVFRHQSAITFSSAFLHALRTREISPFVGVRIGRVPARRRARPALRDDRSSAPGRAR